MTVNRRRKNVFVFCVNHFARLIRINRIRNRCDFSVSNPDFASHLAVKWKHHYSVFDNRIKFHIFSCGKKFVRD
jgi:hypothetical protein